VAKKRELCARVGPIYGFTVADTNAWFKWMRVVFLSIHVYLH
jgi:hypothetical protein